jgi:hypothetical protein
MKKIVTPFVLILCLFLSTSMLAQHLPTTETALKEIICQKWQYTSMERQGRKFDLPAGMNTSVQFFNDNSYIEIIKGKADTATWRYVPKETSIVLAVADGWQKMKIVTVTEKKLLLQMEVEKGVMATMVLLPVK